MKQQPKIVHFYCGVCVCEVLEAVRENGQ